MDNKTNQEINIKEKIILAALELFSNKGYAGTSMRDIAAKVDIKAASLYNHFSGKWNIFEGIIDYMAKEYEIKAAQINIPSDNEKETDIFYQNLSEIQLMKLVEKLFWYFAKDKKASMYRKMLNMEQYRDDRAKEKYYQFFYMDVLDFQSNIFQGMINRGIFVECDARLAAMEFYAPIYFLLGAYDLGMKECEITVLLENHVKEFTRKMKCAG